MIRLFVPDALSAGGRVALADGPAHYLRDVMRRKAGDAILLFNGRDGEWRAEIVELGKRVLALTVAEGTRPQTPIPDLELIVALVKRPRLETIVEKAAELGAARVRLAITEHAQGQRTNVERLAAIATEAAEQTGRLDVPTIDAPAKLEAVLAAWPNHRALIFCDESGGEPLLSSLLPLREKVARAAGRMRGLSEPSAKAASPSRGERSATPHPSASPPPSPARGEGASILIGPEGGFSPAERAQIRAVSGVIPVSLGPRILRADTAAIAAMSLWQAALGDWRP
ncbi:MAG TPA: 16S rRNA (uracil(1498)-N(3))-methyltransferase [Caulobacteraceae bacterium]|nr:16S rRNA (uracil(1498)-N(3))-methyltransferase [Caulobacteraceae bacterium]